MPDFFRYYGRFQNARGGFGSLPPWARSIVTLFAMPGLLLIGLSLALLGVSILALLLLTLPVYRLLRAVTGGRAVATTTPSPTLNGFGPDLSTMFGAAPFDAPPSPGRKPVQVRVVE